MAVREYQKKRRRERIFRAAMELFRNRGFQETTATEIAKAAHVSRGTFFNYYPYKEAVLLDYGSQLLAGLREEVVPALERLGLPVLGVMPRSPLLRSVTVEELARRLDARVLCCRERLDLLVETLSIGAMNVNSAMEFFRRRRNMAVVTGADRTDIQLAALEASTQCLILTGAGEPLPQLISRAEELDVPLLKVEHDTLTTVEVIERTFGHVRLHESVKATYAFRLVEEHCDFERLYTQLQLSVPA